MPIRPIRRPEPSAPPSDVAVPVPVPKAETASHSLTRKRIVARPKATPPVASEPPSMAEPSSIPVKRPRDTVSRTGDNWTDDGDYIVGKARPPAATRWRKGQSGNPRGPKRREEIDPVTAFEDDLLRDFKVKINGEEVTLNLGSFGMRQMKALAGKGDRQAAKYLIDLYREASRARVGRTPDAEIDAAEARMIEQLFSDIGVSPMPVRRRSGRGGAASTGDDD